MFRCDPNTVPKHPVYPQDLAALGYELNDNGQFVNKVTGKFFPPFKSDNERDNKVYTEATHVAARKTVEHELASRYNVKQLFLTGRKGTEIEIWRPLNGDPSVTILCTDRIALRKKSEVVVIIPDRGQDLGIWSWKELLGRGGIDRGSVLGLVKKLQETDLRGSKEKKKCENAGSADNSDATPTKLSENDIPGIMILNPGQLVYSHDARKNMSEHSWLAGPREHALANASMIDDKYNRVPGHKKPAEHVDTVLKHILPVLLPKNARVWMISVGDGAENLVKYMGGRLSVSELRKMTIKDRTIKAMAFIGPTHDPEQVTPDLAKLKLSTRGKSWDTSTEPFGTTLTLPPAKSPFTDDYEDLIVSDPIDIKRRASSPDPLDVQVVGRPDPRYLHGYANYERHRQRAATSPSAFNVAKGSGMPPPNSHLTRFPAHWKVPQLNPLTARSPLEGSPDNSPKEESNIAQEEALKEALIHAAQATSPSSPSYMNQHDRMSPVENDLETALLNRLRRKAPMPDRSDLDSHWDHLTKTFIPPGQDPLIPHPRIWPPVVRDFAYESDAQDVTERDAASPDASRELSTHGDDDVAVFSDSDEVDEEEAGKLRANFAARHQDDSVKTTTVSDNDMEKFAKTVVNGNDKENSPKTAYECSDYQMESAKMLGGDYDGDDGDGLWMKPLKRAPSSAFQEHLGGGGDVSSPGDSAVSVPELEAVSSKSISPDLSDSEMGVPELEPDIGGDAGSNEGGDDDGVSIPAAGQDDSISDTEEGAGQGSNSECAATFMPEDLGYIDEDGALVKYEADSQGEDQSRAPVPGVGDMLRVSGGGTEMELLWPTAEDDVLKWFVEMSQKRWV